MDNTELHYLTYDPEAIYEAMVGAYMENGGDAIAPGSEIDIYLHGVLAVMVRAFAGMDNALRMSTLRYAVGEYLDMIGENRFCERRKASAARATVRMTFAAGASGTVAAGTVLTVDGSMLWETEKNVAITSGGTATVGITCMITGEAGNVLASGEEMQMIVPLNDVLRIVTTTAATGGEEKEQDDAYRERIRIFGMIGSSTGTKTRYESAARTVSGVKDALAWRSNEGQVTITIITRDGHDPETVAEMVTEVAASDSVKPITDDVIVAEAVPVSKAVTATVTLPEEALSIVAASMQTAAAEWMDWQNGKAGRNYNPGKLQGMLYAAGAENVVLSGDSSMAEINNAERCSAVATIVIA